MLQKCNGREAVYSSSPLQTQKPGLKKQPVNFVLMALSNGESPRPLPPYLVPTFNCSHSGEMLSHFKVELTSF